MFLVLGAIINFLYLWLILRRIAKITFSYEKK